MFHILNFKNQTLMSNKETIRRALVVIEDLCNEFDEKRTDYQHNPARFEVLLDKIYRFSHCVNTSVNCYPFHKDWRDELHQEYANRDLR